MRYRVKNGIEFEESGAKLNKEKQKAARFNQKKATNHKKN